MRRCFVALSLTIALLFSAGCGQSGPPAAGTQKDVDTASSFSTARIAFDIDNPENVLYFQHVENLWEQTKPLLLNDLDENYSDEEYKKLGADINMAWVNLQIHSSFDHAEEADEIPDVKFTNFTGDVLMLIDALYGTRGSDSLEGREERRENLRNGRLEYKIKEFDETLARVKKTL